jgi:hypothetical protein
VEQTTSKYRTSEGTTDDVRQATFRAGNKNEQLAVIEKTAKENGIWFNDISFVGEFFSKGGENEVYFSPAKNKVYKINNFKYAGDDVSNFFERIDAHNKLFGNVPYTVIGFTKNSVGEICAILEQPYVEAEREATEEEIVSYMQSSGFKSNGTDDFSNAQYNVFDAVPNNVLFGKDGRLYFIDTQILYDNQEKNIPNITSEISNNLC